MAPAGWVATALPVLAQEGGDSDGGDGGEAEGEADQAASDEEEDEDTVRARAANAQPVDLFQSVGQITSTVNTGSLVSTTGVY